MICSNSVKEEYKKDNNFPIFNEGWHYSVYHSIDEIASVWSSYEQNFDIFLSIRYFQALEACPPEDLQCRYILLYRNDTFIALFPIQMKLFEAQESLKDVNNGENISTFRKSLSKHLKFNTVISGNIMVSGEYMYAFAEEGFTPKERFEWTERILDSYRNVLNSDGYTVSFNFTKDIPKARNIEALGIKSTQFKSFTVEPLMVFHINKNWKTFEDYLADLSSKYRVRAKRCFKKSSDLNVREIGLQEIEQHEDIFYKLYLEVYEGINFSLFQLDKRYFTTLKKFLKDDIRVFVIENSANEIKAFYTLINNGEELHAHFLGYDKEANKGSQIYLKILYRIINTGIDEGFKLVDFGRTALEIKSSVGAIPHEYNLYLKHKNKIANLFVSSLVDYLNKKTEWVPRHPFK